MRRCLFLKRTFSLLVAFSMIMSLCTFNVLAEEPEIGQEQVISEEEIVPETPESVEQEEDASEETEIIEQEEEVLVIDDATEFVSVSTADELEEALAVGGAICLAADFELDRTFYVTNSTYIYSDEERYLTRSSDFGGDIFVVGEDEYGDTCEDIVALTLGNVDSEENLLTIDGNDVESTGTVLFIVNDSCVDLHGVSITNCYKNGNERTLDAKYNFSYSNQIGGAAIILASGTLNIYGGNFSNNRVHDVEGEDSAWGGVIYSVGSTNIYGATFTNNYAARAGALYNYGETHIYNAEFIENSASYRGGAVYMPSNSTCLLFTGEENDIIENSVLFEGNTSEDRGGAIYGQGTLNVNNTRFAGNESKGGHGGAVLASGKILDVETPFVFTNSVFEGNIAYYNGGAVYLTGTSARFDNVDFTSNTSLATANSSGTRYGGAAVYSTGSTSILNDVTFTKNTSDFVSGAMALYSESSATINGVTAEENTAASAGGVFYLSGSELSITDGTFRNNSSGSNGGVLYSAAGKTTATDGTVTPIVSKFNVSDCVFEGNTCATNGGALYFTASEAMIDGAEFTDNAATGHGGAISAHRATDTQIASDIKMNNVTADGNTAGNNGGFLYNNNSLLKIYNSEINNNAALSYGGALSINGDGEGSVYNTTFKGNSSGTEGKNGYGGVCYIDVNGKTNLFHSCTFEENTSNYFGGAIYIGQTASKLNLYNITAKNNSAPKGAVVYQTKTNVIVTINGMTVSGNTATDGGSVVWGNTKYCILNINKNNFTDLDHQGELDESYWETAIANEVTVYDLEFDVPAYRDWGEEGDDEIETDIVVGITSLDQLTKAMGLGYTNFRLDADIEINKTIYITDNIHIFANEPHSIKRAASFGGDMFVVGEDQTGLILEEPVTLTLGKENGEAGLLTIDGNSENMTAEVSGTALFVCGVGQADIYGDVIFKNHTKTNNTRTLLEKYNLSYTNRIGGAALILASGTVNIYGTVFQNNKTNDETSAEEEGMISTQGGAIYSFGKLNIYDGKFLGNYAAKGAALYNYRETHIYNAQFKENHASDRGGAVYMANSVHCKVVLGEALPGKTSKVIFDANTTTGRGAAVYVQGVFNANNTEFVNNIAGGAGGAIAGFGNESIKNDKNVTISNSLFENNQSSGGGAVALYQKATALISGVTFKNNTSTSTGGAVVADSADVKVYNSTFDTNTASSNGGAFMTSGEANVYMSKVKFNDNTSGGNAGAVYSTASKIEIDGAEFTNNSATSQGGAISMHRATASGIASELILNKITATGNTAGAMGGFLYNNHSRLKLYNSNITENTAISHGGAISLQGVAESNIYGSKFVNNVCGINGGSINGGAMYIYNDNTSTLLHSCEFEGNTAPNFGGGMYVSNKAQLTMYNITAKNNSAPKGGFMYETTSGTVVNLSGLTVSGNTASGGGPIIWGNTTNAVLNINKNNYTDLDYSGELDATYWASAIVNKLTVNETETEVPRYQDYNNELYDEYEEVIDVASASELEYAINSGFKNIRIVEDFEIDRTFYITGETMIFSTAKKTLTRKADFAGDIFIVGEDAAGNSSIELGKTAKFILGNQYSESSDLLIIDGNAENMTVDVTGTVIFVEESGQVDLYKNATIQNNRKVGNVRILKDKYLITNASRVGGAAMIISDGTVNVYGATFKSNICNEETTGEGIPESARDSSLGGAIYNRGTFNIYSGLFEDNQSARGGVMYNMRALRIHGGQFIGNHATTNGGAIYLAGSQFSQMYAGDQLNSQVSDKILFKNNTSVSNGGGLYCSSMAIAVIYGDTTFEGNSTESNGGAIATYGMVSTNNVVIRDNFAKGMGAGAYIANSNDDLVTRIVTFENTEFTNNTAKNGGAVAVYASSSELEEGGIVEIKNCDFAGNKAVNTSDKEVTSNVFGGAVYITRKSTLNIEDSNFTENEALFEGGAIYAAGDSETAVSGTTFTKNKTAHESDAKGGAVSVHSATIDFDNATFTENSTCKNGGAIYVSYTTIETFNSDVNIKNSHFEKNIAGNGGGAIYATKHTVETNEDEILNIKNTSFAENTAAFGGAMYLTAFTDAYMKNVTFTKNTSASEKSNAYGGAMYLTNSAVAEIDGGQFTENSSTYCAGAVSLHSSARAIMNEVTAENNSAPTSAGFLYVNNARLDMYGSLVKGNTAGVNGGAFAMYNAAVANVNNTVFDSNKSLDGYAGAIYNTTVDTESVFHSTTFKNNTSPKFGGAMFVNNGAVLKMYNTVAENNSAQKGGVLYETTTDTDVTINGMTVKGNSATEAGPIIFGNTYKSILNIHKMNFTDLDRGDSADDLYWDYAIANELTVYDLSGIEDEIPECDTYVPKTDKEESEKERVPVPVTDVLSLGLNSDSGALSYLYGRLPKLDKSSNFMSRSTTVFPNINGTDVTVDTFVSHKDDPANNCTVGEGILLYQSILYKEAHPEEEVNISIASFRFSALAAVCINRDSRYFGYMRNLTNADYDKYGFVRLSYLLVTAAKMGINVTVVGQLDGYPQPSSAPTLYEYFTYYLDEPCDPKYAEGKFVRDYMDFGYCEWTSYDNKAATDMMHTKMCAVSHYLDMDGNVQRNAVWSSSSNLDGINTNATNGNNKMQTATIVSNHEAIYRSAYNYINILPEYCGQEEVYQFRTLVADMSKNQIDLIESGRGDEIKPEEQIVYLGTENDDVFEFYFSPFGGDVVTWSESYNPYCKFVRKFSNSDDYVTLIWNSANYDKSTPIVLQIEDMLIKPFQENKNVNNKIYINLEDFDTSKFNNLVVGKDIGLKNFNKYELGALHSKDLQLSYSENGKRQYVSILSSINMHGGAMSYQSNYVLVIKEDNCREDSVYFNIADQTSKGVVEHDYSEIKTYLPEDPATHGYAYKECIQCGLTEKLDTVHRPGEWKVAKEATATENGVSYRECTACGEVISAKEIVGKETESNYTEGVKFTKDTATRIRADIQEMPRTFEAVVMIPKTYTGRSGAIISNYKADRDNLVCLEGVYNGKLRLYYRNNGAVGDCSFNTDVRSNAPRHIAVTVDGNVATLYIDGIAKEVKTLKVAYPSEFGNMYIGGDDRTGNLQYFRGTIYSATMFSDVRTAEEIKSDAVVIPESGDNLLYSKQYPEEVVEEVKEPVNTVIHSKAVSFDAAKSYPTGALSASPKTFEAIVSVPETQSDRAGVVVSNFSGGTEPQISIEIYSNGRPRLFAYINSSSKIDCVFSTDVRSDIPRHMAITVSGKKATLYLDGEAVETKTLKYNLPETTTNFKVGGDDRSENSQYFKGQIQSVAMFGDVRSAEEIKKDASFVAPDAEDLLFAGYFADVNEKTALVSLEGNTFTKDNAKALYNLPSVPYTFDAVVNMPKSVEGRGGVIVGNYSSKEKNVVSFEIYNNGNPRLYWTSNGVTDDCVFDTDIRGDKSVRVTITVDENIATLYLDGEAVESMTMASSLPDKVEDLKLGGDNRNGNGQYFKGTIYAAAFYSETLSEEDIKKGILANMDNALYSGIFTKKIESAPTVTGEGRTFTSKTASLVPVKSNEMISTFEAVVQIPKDVEGRAGVIAGNYMLDRTKVTSFEIYEGGKVRLYGKTGGKNQVINCIFDTDIRGNNPVHIAVTIDGLAATLYLNGEKTETKTLKYAFTDMSELKIGGDNRKGNDQYFKGTIYSVALFSDIRSDEEIMLDVAGVSEENDGIIYNTDFTKEICAESPTGGGHTESDWIIDREPADGETGLKHTECILCNIVLVTKEYVASAENGMEIDFSQVGAGRTFASDEDVFVLEELTGAPLTIEASFNLPKSYSDRAGVIFGNYDGGTGQQINVEIYNNGKPRLYYKNSKNKAYTYLFETDVRSDSIVHLAITVEGTKANLYLNGELKETVTITGPFASVTTGFKVGADNRTGSQQYFKGTLYGVNIFSDVRTAEEIALDRYLVSKNADGLLYTKYFAE